MNEVLHVLLDDIMLYSRTQCLKIEERVSSFFIDGNEMCTKYSTAETQMEHLGPLSNIVQDKHCTK